jgi:hypothetical protein
MENDLNNKNDFKIKYILKFTIYNMSQSIELNKQPSTLPKVLEQFFDNIDLFDQDEYVTIYNYKYCDNNSSEETKNLKGLIFDKKGNQLFKSVGYTEEYVPTTVPLEKLENLEKYKIYNSEEGTLIKLFFVKEAHRWYVSTNKKLNAYKCKWNSKESFGEIFERSIGKNIDEFTCNFNTSYLYLFLLRNNNTTRVVCNSPEKNKPKLFHVGTMNENGEYIEVDLGEPRLTELQFSNKNDLLEYVNHIDPFELQGVILFEHGKRPFKILNPKYQEYLNVRGNQMSIPFRYIQVRKTPMEELLRELYPEYTSKFNLYEQAIKVIARNIYDVYVNRFIKKEFTQTDQISYRIIKEVHGKHISDRKFKVTLDVIENTMCDEKFNSSVNQLVKNYMLSSQKL